MASPESRRLRLQAHGTRRHLRPLLTLMVLMATAAMGPPALAGQACQSVVPGTAVEFRTEVPEARWAGLLVRLDQESVEVDFGHTTQEFALDSVYDFRARCTLVDPSTHATQGAALGAVLLGSLGLISAIAFVASDEFDTSFGDAAQLFGIPTLTGALVGGLIGAAFPKRIDWRSVDPRTAGAGTRASPLSISLAPTPGEPGAWSVGLRVHLGR